MDLFTNECAEQNNDINVWLVSSRASTHRLLIARIRQLNVVWSRALLSALVYLDFVVDLNLRTLKMRLSALKKLKLCTTSEKGLP